MSEINMLDNLADQELREMIINKTIDLKELDYSTITKILDYEIDLLCFGEGNLDIIEQCALLLETSTVYNSLSNEQIQNIIADTKEKYVTIIHDNNHSDKRSFDFSKNYLKKVAVIAATIMLIAISSSLVAVAFGFDIFEFLASVVRENKGSKVDEGGFTFYNNGETKLYMSVEELLEEESLDIMYPSVLPENIKLERITVGTNSNGNQFLTFITDNPDTNITVELMAQSFDSNSPAVYESNGIVYYIQDGEICVAYSYHNGNSYYICAQTKENLIFIIDNMKE